MCSSGVVKQNKLYFTFPLCIHHPTDRIAHSTAFVTPVIEHWLEQKLWGHVSTFLVPTVTHTHARTHAHTHAHTRTHTHTSTCLSLYLCIRLTAHTCSVVSVYCGGTLAKTVLLAMMDVVISCSSPWVVRIVGWKTGSTWTPLTSSLKSGS